MQTVSLRPMTAEEFAQWGEGAVESFAQDLARSMERPLDAARAHAAAQFVELLPDGLDSPATHLLVVVDEWTRSRCFGPTERWRWGFGFNHTARRLYESLGYETVSVQMTKSLSG